MLLFYYSSKESSTRGLHLLLLFSSPLMEALYSIANEIERSDGLQEDQKESLILRVHFPPYLTKTLLFDKNQTIKAAADDLVNRQAHLFAADNDDDKEDSQFGLFIPCWQNDHIHGWLEPSSTFNDLKLKSGVRTVAIFMSNYQLSKVIQIIIPLPLILICCCSIFVVKDTVECRRHHYTIVIETREGVEHNVRVNATHSIAHMLPDLIHVQSTSPYIPSTLSLVTAIWCTSLGSCVFLSVNLDLFVTVHLFVFLILQWRNISKLGLTQFLFIIQALLQVW